MSHHLEHTAHLDRKGLLFVLEDALPEGKLNYGHDRRKKKAWVCQRDIISVQNKGIFLLWVGCALQDVPGQNSHRQRDEQDAGWSNETIFGLGNLFI